jgi:outer membrane lipoprotein-sorting protein
MNAVRILLSVAVLWAGATASALAQQIPLDEVSAYFNAFATAEADFTQINPDGSITTGRLMIHRPGRMRFEYDEPDDNLVIAGGGQVAVFDARSNQPPSQFPLARTPLGIILSPQVDMTRARMVVDHFSDDTTTTVVAQDPENPEYGNIRLVFTDDPVELRQWVVTDDTGSETTVILGNLTFGDRMRASLFDITGETARRGGSR